jgi:hypothetical protein
MSESKRTKATRPRATRKKIAEPPVIERLPFHQEAYYAGLGLVDWAAEHAGQLSGKLRLIEKQLVQRGQHPNNECTKRLDAARAECGRRGREIQSNAAKRLRSIWDAVRGTPRTSEPGTKTAPGTA